MASSHVPSSWTRSSAAPRRATTCFSTPRCSRSCNALPRPRSPSGRSTRPKGAKSGSRSMRAMRNRTPSRKDAVESTRFLERELPTYLDHLSVERGLSAASVTAYRSDLETFGRFLAERELSAAKTTRADLGRYLSTLRARGLSSRSTARAVSAVRGFYGFAAAHLGFTEDPTADLSSPRSGLALPKALSEREVEALLAAPVASEPLGLRDRAMLELLYASGLRVSEIVN